MGKNLIEFVKDNIVVNGDLQEKMFEILELNIEDYNTLEEIKHYMGNEAYCSTGAVSGLVYYSETREIFEAHYDEILTLYNEKKEEYGELNFELSFNSLVWFVFEEIVRDWHYQIEDLECEEVLDTIDYGTINIVKNSHEIEEDFEEVGTVEDCDGNYYTVYRLVDKDDFFAILND